MTKKRKTSYLPVSSFSPLLFQALVKGAKEEVRLKFKSSKEVIACQARIHHLRASMRRENHPLTTAAYRALTQRDKDGVTLIIRPHDSQFDEVFEKAGITMSDIDESVLTALDTPPAQEPASPIPSPSSEPLAIPDIITSDLQSGDEDDIYTQGASIGTEEEKPQ